MILVTELRWRLFRYLGDSNLSSTQTVLNIDKAVIVCLVITCIMCLFCHGKAAIVFYLHMDIKQRFSTIGKDFLVQQFFDTSLFTQHLSCPNQNTFSA